ncbi:hypothetical protein SAMN05444166_3135 [Singulisphaera sp. GP187]|nr:hypothetical protein SAMN05444166_3135 [Singulisphaera sp. GP187]
MASIDDGTGPIPGAHFAGLVRRPLKRSNNIKPLSHNDNLFITSSTNLDIFYSHRLDLVPG